MTEAEGGIARLRDAPFTGGSSINGSVSAAAGEQDNGNDDDPDAVVIEQIAETVIHNGSSVND